MELGHIFWPSDPVTRESKDPETQLTHVDLCCRQMFAMGKRFASFYRCLASARFWKVKFWRLVIKRQYFNDGWMDYHKNIYIFILPWAFFENRKTRVSHRVKMMTRWPGRERWPIDPVTQWPISMSGRQQTSPPVRCRPWWVGLSKCHGVKSVLPLLSDKYMYTQTSKVAKRYAPTSTSFGHLLTAQFLIVSEIAATNIYCR